MSDTKTLDILKQALLLERRGKILYETIALQTKIQSVKEFFKQMALEEESHITTISTHFKQFNEHGEFKHPNYDFPDSQSITNHVLTDKIQKEIAAASFEAAAISAAMSLEQQAINLYTDRATHAENSEEKKLYEWLAAWERTHLDFLSSLDNSIQQNIWFDNHFWPM